MLAKERIKEKIGAYLREEILFDDVPVDGPALIAEGLLDSFGILKMASFLEKEFGLQLSPMELTLENFETLEKIVEHTWNKLTPSLQS